MRGKTILLLMFLAMFLVTFARCQHVTEENLYYYKYQTLLTQKGSVEGTSLMGVYIDTLSKSVTFINELIESRYKIYKYGLDSTGTITTYFLISSNKAKLHVIFEISSSEDWAMLIKNQGIIIFHNQKPKQ